MLPIHPMTTTGLAFEHGIFIAIFTIILAEIIQATVLAVSWKLDINTIGRHHQECSKYFKTRLKDILSKKQHRTFVLSSPLFRSTFSWGFWVVCRVPVDPTNSCHYTDTRHHESIPRPWSRPRNSNIFLLPSFYSTLTRTWPWSWTRKRTGRTWNKGTSQ